MGTCSQAQRTVQSDGISRLLTERTPDWHSVGRGAAHFLAACNFYCSRDRSSHGNNNNGVNLVEILPQQPTSETSPSNYSGRDYKHYTLDCPKSQNKFTILQASDAVASNSPDYNRKYTGQFTYVCALSLPVTSGRSGAMCHLGCNARADIDGRHQYWPVRRGPLPSHVVYANASALRGAAYGVYTGTPRENIHWKERVTLKTINSTCSEPDVTHNDQRLK